MTTSLTLGALRLTATPCNCVGDTCTMLDVVLASGTHAKVHRDEWQSLLAVSAVIEAARAMLHAWNDVPAAHSYQRDASLELRAAIDALSAKDPTHD